MNSLSPGGDERVEGGADLGTTGAHNSLSRLQHEFTLATTIICYVHCDMEWSGGPQEKELMISSHGGFPEEHVNPLHLDSLIFTLK